AAAPRHGGSRAAPARRACRRASSAGGLRCLGAGGAWRVGTSGQDPQRTKGPSVRQRTEAGPVGRYLVGLEGRPRSMLTLESVRNSARTHHRAGAGHVARWQVLERELSDARAEVARLRAELAGTEAGARRARHEALHDSLT